MIAATVSRRLQIKLETSFQSYKDIWPAIIAPRQTMCSGCMQNVSLACCSVAATFLLHKRMHYEYKHTSEDMQTVTCTLQWNRVAATFLLHKHMHYKHTSEEHSKPIYICNCMSHRNSCTSRVLLLSSKKHTVTKSSICCDLHVI